MVKNPGVIENNSDPVQEYIGRHYNSVLAPPIGELVATSALVN